MSSQLKKKLTIIPTPIGNMSDVSERVLACLSSVDLLLCESLGKTKLLYQLLGLKLPKVMRYWQKTEHAIISRLGELEGHIGLITDAGMPCISDPGFSLVSACYDHGFEVSVIPGPSALVAAVAMSGIPCEEFQFLGFLPPKSTACQGRLQSLYDLGVTGVLYESPHRVVRLCEDILAVFGAKHQICVVKELSKKHEACYRGTVDEVIQQIGASTIKGEFCVVIDRATPKPKWQKDALLLREYLSCADASTVCAKIHNISRSNAYRFLLDSENG